jgi:quinol monooxygenase YgiN
VDAWTGSGSGHRGRRRGDGVAARVDLTSPSAQFFLAAIRIRRQALRSDGAVGVSLIARPIQRTFFTLSAWRDREALDAMVRTEPHRSVMAAFRNHTSDATFVSWQAPADNHPTWTDAIHRLGDHVPGNQPPSAP